MKLSIITVNLNDCAGLQKTLQSVSTQSSQDYEHVVIDGGSTDGSAELLHRWAPKLAYARSESDDGIYNAMNKGVAAAQNEYLLFLNAGDTFADTDVLRDLCRVEPKSDIVYGNAMAVGVNQTSPLVYPHPLTLEFLFVSSIAHEAALIRRELLLESPYDETLRVVSDWKFFMESFLAAHTFGYIDRTIAHFDITGISSRPACHALQRQERDAVLLALLGYARMRHVAGQVALGYLPEFLKPCASRFPEMLYGLYWVGRRMRQMQTQCRLWFDV